MTPNDVIRLFHLNPEQRIQQEDLTEYQKILSAYRHVEYERAKKTLLIVIEKHGKLHPKFFYMEKVFRKIQSEDIEEGNQKARGRKPHVPSPKKSL